MRESLVLLLLAGLPLSVPADDSAPRTLTLSVPAAGLETLALQANVGEMHVTTSSDDRVHAQVTLRRKDTESLWFFHWISVGTSQDIAAAAISQQRSGTRLTLSLSYPHEHDADELKQEWDVQVPARLKLTVDMQVGELNIEGVGGGVTAKLNVGELSLDTPHGAMDASVNVGEIRARSGSAHHGAVNLSSSIGDTVLVVQGGDSGFHEHGGLGSRVTLDGQGADPMRLQVNIGEVTLHLNPQGTGSSP